jgi:outer membrane receptor for monomeric catechols
VPQFGLRRNDDPVEAETSEGFEVGSKGVLFDGVMTYEAGLFITDRENVAVSDPSNAPGETFVVSAGKVRAEGAEFTSTLNPTESLEITVNLGYTKLDVKEGNDEISEPFFPKYNASVFANYEFDSGLSTGLGIRYMDERKTDTVMASGDKLVFADYYVLDLNVGYQITDDLDVQLDILNLTNEKYLENTTGFAANMNSGNTLGAPLTAAVTLNWTIGH